MTRCAVSEINAAHDHGCLYSTPFLCYCCLLNITTSLNQILPMLISTITVTIAPTPIPEWNMNDNVKCLVNRTRTLSKLRSGEEEDYEEEWARIGRMVSAEAFEFGLHAGEERQEGSCD